MVSPSSEAFKEWVGRQDGPKTDVVTPRLIESFRATLGAALFEGGPSAPLGLHWCLSPAIVAPEEIGPDGHPEKGGFLPPIALPRRMWAGGQVELYAPIEVGDEVQKLSQIKDVNFKQGRSGPLAFVTVVHRFSTSRGLAVKERHDIVYREASSSGVGGKSDPGTVPAEGDSIAVDAVTLFRYSALTFNGHRIHYDHPYTTQIEGYDGLVIHGPLQATYLLNLAARVAGCAPTSFTFRSIAPAQGAQTLKLTHQDGPEGMQLAVFSENGRQSMAASARW